ncbi:MAG: succinate dehydrogenase, hydrophobic membrane anchor protein [Gammaproteobacteria bacterium]|nr:succinate dehydrogenase, hydrophobic membrane anchor protein [Gammaproteobacteria bacterium]
MSLRHPLALARGLGSAKDGVGHWWVQRLTAMALLLLAPWFIWLALGLIGADHFTVRQTLAQPLNASLLLAFVLSLFWHAQLGLQVVIEDYVHGWLEIALQVAVKFAYAFGALASAIAIGRIAFTA